jgi:hypothetical protein
MEPENESKRYPVYTTHTHIKSDIQTETYTHHTHVPDLRESSARDPLTGGHTQRIHTPHHTYTHHKTISL